MKTHQSYQLIMIRVWNSVLIILQHY
jgi:hypothetical protein